MQSINSPQLKWSRDLAATIEARVDGFVYYRVLAARAKVAEAVIAVCGGAHDGLRQLDYTAGVERDQLLV